jgi:hypothetical protein
MRKLFDEKNNVSRLMGAIDCLSVIHDVYGIIEMYSTDFEITFYDCGEKKGLVYVNAFYLDGKETKSFGAFLRNCNDFEKLEQYIKGLVSTLKSI